jgi:peptidase M42 family hydrolase
MNEQTPKSAAARPKTRRRKGAGSKARRSKAVSLSEALDVDMDYLRRVLRDLLEIPSPTGFTDNIVHYACAELETLGVSYELTRRGAIRANLEGRQRTPDRAVVAHLDTLGAMVKSLKENGRLAIAPIGTWSPRFAEGARISVFAEEATLRGTILPLKASGHTYNKEIDTQPVAWENLEIRLDERVVTLNELIELGVNVGDFVAIDPVTEFGPNGFVNSRYLDDKAGVAALMAAVRAVKQSGHDLHVDCHVILTIAEEVGVGVSGTLHGDVAEMVTVDNGTVAPGQNTNEYGVTVAMQDSSGPFDYHLSRKLIELCRTKRIPFSRDVFRFYRSDSASALQAGNDVRTALACFGLDASHGYERVHEDSLQALAQLLGEYILSEPGIARDQIDLGPIDGFPTQPD